ncbi:MAG: TRAP transporter small permease [Tropicimonas sp.]|uniref:TRAP transporter small permease n=1 Tax=Tropicimonas sp. TaxID=2067044 RepID=UPI003A88F763
MTPAERAGAPGGREGAGRPFPIWLGGIPVLLDWSGRLIAVTCLLFTFVALLVNVILRYVFGSGIAWAYEIHAILLPWLVAGGVVIAAARGRNIAITLLPDLLAARGRQMLAIAINAAILAISLAVLDSSQPILKASKFQTLSTLGVKQIWGYSSLVYAFGGMAVIAVVDLLRALTDRAAFDDGIDPGKSSLS